MRPHNLRFTFIAVLSMGLLAACGGSTPTTEPLTPPSEPAPVEQPPAQRLPPLAPEPVVLAQGLEYTDPTSTGWRLVKDASSTATRLVLNLVGPSGESGRGIGFNLASDGNVAFARFEDGAWLKDTGVFALGKLGMAAGAYDPVLRAGGVQKGGKLLTVGVFQKDRRQPPQALDATLLQVAIEFDGARVQERQLATGTEVALSITKAKVIPEDIGVMPANPTAFDANYASVIAKSRMQSISLSVGTLVLR